MNSSGKLLAASLLFRRNNKPRHPEIIDIVL